MLKHQRDNISTCSLILWWTTTLVEILLSKLLSYKLLIVIYLLIYGMYSCTVIEEITKGRM